MAPQCERCKSHLGEKRGGLRDRLGLRSYDGYECSECGTLLCGECFRRRRRELAGSAHDTCPVCSGLLSHR